MNNLNSILIEGVINEDSLFRVAPKGTAVCTFLITSSRYNRNEENLKNLEKEVSFFKIETWGKLAEMVYDKGKQGRGVRVVGRLKEERWQDSDGKPQSKIVIVAEHVEFRPVTAKKKSTRKKR